MNVALGGALEGWHTDLHVLGLHAALGFEPAGVVRDAGHKHCRWLDIVLMQKVLNGGGARDPSGPGLPLA